MAGDGGETRLDAARKFLIASQYRRLISAGMSGAPAAPGQTKLLALTALDAHGRSPVRQHLLP